MLRYFWEGLRSSVLTELEYQDLKLEIFDQMAKKAVNVKAKLAFRPRFNTNEMDQNCPRGSQLANSIVAKS